jgi:hypothetical protein
VSQTRTTSGFAGIDIKNPPDDVNHLRVISPDFKNFLKRPWQKYHYALSCVSVDVKEIIQGVILNGKRYF